MERRFGGSTLDCAEMSVQEPRRGSATPGWMAASSPSISKVRIVPPESTEQSLADSDSSVGESRVSVNTRNQAQTYEPVPGGVPLSSLWFLGATGEFWRRRSYVI